MRHHGIHIVRLGFRKENLLYDIRNITFMTGDQLPEQQDEKTRANIQDVDLDFLHRKLELAYSDLKERLYTYLSRPVVRCGMKDDDPLERTEYVLWLRVPEEMSETSLELVKNLLHEYLVDFTLYEWFSITKKDEAQQYYVHCDNYIDRIRECMGHRIRRRPRPLFPPF